MNPLFPTLTRGTFLSLWIFSKSLLEKKLYLLLVFGSSLSKLVNQKADGGITALHMAALNGHAETMHLLLDLGASVSQVTVEDGSTIDLIGLFLLLSSSFLVTLRFHPKASYL